MRSFFLLILVAEAASFAIPHRQFPVALPRAAACDEGVPFDDAADIQYYSRRKQSEERYPYEVYDTAPPGDIIGVFSLPPMLGCGDILRVDADRAYVIKRIASRYKYTSGKFALESKRADATEVNRAAAEKKLARLLASGT